MNPRVSMPHLTRMCCSSQWYPHESLRADTADGLRTNRYESLRTHADTTRRKDSCVRLELVQVKRKDAYGFTRSAFDSNRLPALWQQTRARTAPDYRQRRPPTFREGELLNLNSCVATRVGVRALSVQPLTDHWLGKLSCILSLRTRIRFSRLGKLSCIFQLRTWIRFSRVMQKRGWELSQELLWSLPPPTNTHTG